MTENSKQFSILIVDDSPENIDILNDILKNHFKVKAAVNGYQTIQIANSDDPPDIILLDVMMPEINGFTVCERLKTNVKTSEIPVIFLTVSSEPDNIIKGFESGGVDYIIKPFNAVELLTRLNTHLQLKNATDMLKDQNIILEKMVATRTEMLQKKNESLSNALLEKDALLFKVKLMQKRLRKSLKITNKLYNKIQTIQEDERKRISSDIHDEMGQMLTALKLKLYQINGKLKNDDQVNDKIETALQMVDDTIKATQRIAKQLRPDILDNLGLSEAVTSLCKTINESAGIKFELEITGNPLELNKETELCIYRVIQEAITNMIRHSNSKKADIHIENTADFLNINIRDYGTGIDRIKIRHSDSLGIFGMKKRINSIHGKFHIEGSEGNGTSISISIPSNGEKHGQSHNSG